MLCILCIHMVISQAMLKLTHSFYRYMKFTCDYINFNTTHVKSYSHIICGRKTCVTLYAQHSITDSFTHTCRQLRPLTNIKRKLRLKNPHNSANQAQVTMQMNNELLPSVTYVSHGGAFQVENASSVHWSAASTSTSSHHSNNQRRSKIPSDFRKWERLAKEANGERFRFRVVSYNVLAQYLLECHPYLYTDSNPEDLSWNVRSERLFKEILDLDPDIICLQEVQSSHMKSFYVRFEQCGYYGIYKQKTGHREDGCAIYYKTDRFILDDHLTVEYNQPEMPILNRDNVGLMMKLLPRGSCGTAIVVATTHLLYNPKRTDVRLAQLQVLLAELDRFAYYDQDNGRRTGYYPIVLTGDFNSLPGSAVIQLLDVGKISAIGHRDCSDWRRIAVTDNCQHLSVTVNRPRGVYSDFRMIKLHNSEVVNCGIDAGTSTSSAFDQEIMRHSFMFNTSMLRYPLKLGSVYPRTKVDHNEEATTFQTQWVTVDYIYFSCCNKLRLLERLRLPTKMECEVLGQLPNDVYGSDHLILAASFEIC